MDELRFHLDGVVRSKSEYVDFDGPLELILQLLSRNRVEIQDIRISSLLEQYLDYLAEMRRMDLEIASEFVAMASHLTYIKAKTVLAGTEPVEELDELKNSLEELRRRREYERAKHMADLLAPMAARGEGLFVKQPEPLGKEKGYRYQHEKEELRRLMLLILSRETEAPGIPESFAAPARLVYPIGEKSEEIMTEMRRRRRMSVREIFREAKSRSELVASFVSVLELCRSGSLLLVEENGEYVAELPAEGQPEQEENHGA